jgi:trk system potassium uptake protein TrkH
MLPSLIVSVIYSETGSSMAFILSIAILIAAAVLMNLFKPLSTDFYARDGFAVVGVGWLLLSVLGCLPYVFSGAIPNFINALFECVSGLTTTGASILPEVETLPKSILFWRAFTNWMGGMGVLVLMMAILPSVKANTIHIMQAEAPGPYVDKFTPRIGWVARILYGIYLAITVVEVALLLIGGMPLYDALVHSFATVSTGGFSSRNLSVGAYHSAYIEIVIAVFMIISGVNLSLYQLMARRKVREALKDEEMRLYFIIIGASVVCIAINLILKTDTTVGDAIRGSLFQVGSVITTTGFSSTDFNLWPTFSKTVLVLLMFVGGCAGSTAGGLKCMRLLLIFKTVRRETARILHPKSVKIVKLNGKPVEESILSGILSYTCLYVLVLAVAMLVVSIDGFDFVSTFTACLSAISNIGPGLGMVGPMGNFADFSNLSTFVLTLCMLLGRLEIYPILILCVPSFWRQINR